MTVTESLGQPKLKNYSLPLINAQITRIISCAQISHGCPWTEPAIQHKDITE